MRLSSLSCDSPLDLREIRALRGIEEGKGSMKDWIAEKKDALRIASEDACSAFNELRLQLLEAKSRIAYLQDQIKRRDDELASLYAHVSLYREEGV